MARTRRSGEAPRGQERDAYMLALGQRLRSLREARSMTQAECAERSGLGPDVISRLENGRYTSPGLRTLIRLADALALRPAELLPDGGELRNQNAARARINTLLAHARPAELELIEELASVVLKRRAK